MFSINNQNSKGVSLYLAIAIMTILLALALGVSTILIGQIKMLKGMGDSVIAFYAADTGIENTMYEYYVNGNLLDIPTTTIGAAFYNTKAFAASDPNCPSPPNDYYCIKSFGTYQETKRAIEVSY